MDREALIFLHIPKTADYRAAIQSFCNFHDGSISDQGDSGTTQTTSGWAPSPVAGGARTLFYGIPECLPQGATYITMLREPVARVLSAYYFILRRPLHPLHRKLKRERLGIRLPPTIPSSPELAVQVHCRS